MHAILKMCGLCYAMVYGTCSLSDTKKSVSNKKIQSVTRESWLSRGYMKVKVQSNTPYVFSV